MTFEHQASIKNIRQLPGNGIMHFWLEKDNTPFTIAKGRHCDNQFGKRASMI
jgi:hypothetical protein